MATLLKVFQQEFDNSGDPNVGGTITVYNHDTLDLADVYSSIDGEIPIPNPISLGSNGRVNIFVGSGIYDAVLKDSLGNTLAQSNGISGGINGSTGTVKFYNTIEELRASSAGSSDIAELSGYYVKGDGKAFSKYYWDATSSADDNGGSIIEIIGDPTYGRWLAVVDGPVTPYQFGAKGDGVTDDTTQVTKAKDFCEASGLDLTFQNGNFLIGANLTFNCNVKFIDGGYISGVLVSGDPAYTLTFNKPLEVDRVKIFDESILRADLNDNIYCYPEWWGALADDLTFGQYIEGTSVDSTKAIVASVRSLASEVKFGPGTYWCDPIYWNRVPKAQYGAPLSTDVRVVDDEWLQSANPSNKILTGVGNGRSGQSGDSYASTGKRTVIKYKGTDQVDYFWRLWTVHSLKMKNLTLNGNLLCDVTYWPEVNCPAGRYENCTFEWSTPSVGVNVFVGDEAFNSQVDTTDWIRCVFYNPDWFTVPGVPESLPTSKYCLANLKLRGTNTILQQFTHCWFVGAQDHINITGANDTLFEHCDFYTFTNYLLNAPQNCDYIMRNCYTEATFKKVPSDLLTVTVTASDSSGTLLFTGGNPGQNNFISFVGSDLPSGIVAGNWYCVTYVSPTTFFVSDSILDVSRGIRLPFVDAGSGTIQYKEELIYIDGAVGVVNDNSGPEASFAKPTIIENNRFQGQYNTFTLRPNKKIIVRGNRIAQGSLYKGKIDVLAPTIADKFFPVIIEDNGFSLYDDVISEVTPGTTIRRNNYTENGLLPDLGLLAGIGVPIGRRKHDLQIKDNCFADNASGIFSIGKNFWLDDSDTKSLGTGPSVRVDFNTTTGSFDVLTTTTDATTEDENINVALLKRLEVDKTGVKITGRQQGSKGADIASANDLVLGNSNYFHVTGTTTINAIDATNWTDGSVVSFLFKGITTVKHNTVGGAGTLPLKMLTAADVTTADGTRMTFIKDATEWVQY